MIEAVRRAWIQGLEEMSFADLAELGELVRYEIKRRTWTIARAMSADRDRP